MISLFYCLTFWDHFLLRLRNLLLFEYFRSVNLKAQGIPDLRDHAVGAVFTFDVDIGILFVKPFAVSVNLKAQGIPDLRDHAVGAKLIPDYEAFRSASLAAVGAVFDPLFQLCHIGIQPNDGVFSAQVFHGAVV